MMMPDVNVLLGAFRADHPHHGLCKPWLDRLTASGETYALSTLVLSAVVRIATNSRIFVNPSTPVEAFDFCGTLLEDPAAALTAPGLGHWPIFKRLCTSLNIKGATVTDAWFAALAIEGGHEMVTLDRDYGRIPGLLWRTP
jgi:uncharacterized protein